MSNLEPEPGFYNENGYGEVEKHFLHYATVSMLNIYIYNIQVISLSSFFLISQLFCFKLIFYSLNNILIRLVSI